MFDNPTVTIIPVTRLRNTLLFSSSPNLGVGDIITNGGLEDPSAARFVVVRRGLTSTWIVPLRIVIAEPIGARLEMDPSQVRLLREEELGSLCFKTNRLAGVLTQAIQNCQPGADPVDPASFLGVANPGPQVATVQYVDSATGAGVQATVVTSANQPTSTWIPIPRSLAEKCLVVMQLQDGALEEEVLQLKKALGLQN